MVLLGRLCGRVGRCREFILSPVNHIAGLFYLLGGITYSRSNALRWSGGRAPRVPTLTKAPKEEHGSSTLMMKEFFKKLSLTFCQNFIKMAQAQGKTKPRYKNLGGFYASKVSCFCDWGFLLNRVFLPKIAAKFGVRQRYEFFADDCRN
jgi:hypothetical protein